MTRFATAQASTGFYSSGFCGLPFPYTTSVGDSSFYPIAVPKKAEDSTDPCAARFAWRTRYWTPVSNAVVSDGTNSKSWPAIELVDLSGRTTEGEIVTISQGGQGHVENSEVGVEFLFLFMTQIPESMWKDGDDWRPHVSIQGSLIVGDGMGNGGNIIISSRAADPNFTGVPSTLTGSIDTVPLTIYYEATTTGTGSASISTFALNPTTFWGWGGKVNTSTGLPTP